MTASPVLETERLILRLPNGDDFEAWAAFHAEEDTMRFLGGIQPYAASWRGLCAMVGAWQVRGFAMFSVIERSTGAWVGRIGPWQPEGWPGTEVGWGIRSAFAGKGYAREAAIASMDYAVDVLGWTEIIHTIDPENLSSIRLATSLGSTNLGPTQLPAPLDQFRVDSWGQSADQWRARRASR